MLQTCLTTEHHKKLKQVIFRFLRETASKISKDKHFKSKKQHKQLKNQANKQTTPAKYRTQANKNKKISEPPWILREVNPGRTVTVTRSFP